jgi:hypothetical protein
LKEILQDYDHTNLNEGLQEIEQCVHCHQQLSNAMAAHHYGGVGDAREVLKNMRVILDIKRLKDFPEISTRYALFPELLPLSRSTDCAIDHVQVTKYPIDPDPDLETLDLIAQHNADDLMLYQFVKTLPQYET